MIDVNAPVPRNVLRNRMNSLQGWMRTEGLDAIVVCAQGSALAMATKSHGDLRFLLDWDGDVTPSALVLPAEGPPALVVGAVFPRMVAQENPLLREVRLGRGPAFAEAVLQLLPDGAKRVGLTGRTELSLVNWEPLARAGAGGWRDCTAELARRRAIKDEIQIAYHRDAARICDEMCEQLGPELRSGKSVFQIQVALERLARSRECEVCKTWLTVAPIADRPRFRRDENRRVPAEGDQVLFAIMLLKHGHWGHSVRTGAMGAASAAAREIFDVVEDIHSRMIDRLRPGADLRLVNEVSLATFEAYLQKRGNPAHFQFRAAHAMGHSYEDPVGTAEFPQPYDPNEKAPSTPTPIRAGMLFEVHPNLFVKDAPAAAIGDMVLINDDGPELLTLWPRELARF